MVGVMDIGMSLEVRETVSFPLGVVSRRLWSLGRVDDLFYIPALLENVASLLFHMFELHLMACYVFRLWIFFLMAVMSLLYLVFMDVRL